ncbi:MAG TPA: alkaline phosphatase family protein [Opitutaceae bacterium]|nr:alkaline phosphatase family protein [Opitutaceae bacterium]
MSLRPLRRALPLALGLAFAASLFAAPEIRYVIHVSVDGLRPDSITALPAVSLPHFHRLRTQSAGTDNARCDSDISVTLPNHTTQLTGRPILGPAGHNWTWNRDPAPGQTLASNKGSYIAGVFDVAHDHGLRTAAYVSKSKFSLFASSWDAAQGAPDSVAPDNGRAKIDVYRCDENTAALVARLAADQRASPAQYVFLHIGDLDAIGHKVGWDPAPGSDYSNTLLRIDNELGVLFDLIDTTPELAGRTAIVLTADHGGFEKNHGDAARHENYTIPFYVWGPGIAGGVDLYALNPARRRDPGETRPGPEAAPQPIRNGEAGNLSLQLLGLVAIPGSTIGAAQDLTVSR